MYAVLLRFGHDTGEAMEGHRLAGDSRPSARAGIVFLCGSMSDDSLDAIPVPYSHNNTSSNPPQCEAMG
jgi:hypothetical protein